MVKKLVFYNNSLNHHQVFLADELYNLLGDAFVYVAICPSSKVNLKGGRDYSDRCYCLKVADSPANYNEALELARTAITCVFGAESIPFARERAYSNPNGLSFEVGERWLKKGLLNVLSPRLMRWWWYYQTLFRKANFYKLCASAFAARDHLRLHSYVGRCFKWGYFTEVKPYIDEFNNDVSFKDGVTFLWCARYLSWKHPELAIKLSYLLKRDNRSFHLYMIGEGEMKPKIEQMIRKQGLEDVVTLIGNVPNDEAIKRMKKCDIFLFTSDRNEGWGAVANEAMSNRCLLVGSDEIGSVPYLVSDGENGMVFKSRSISSLYNKVSFLLDNPEIIKQMALRGSDNMVNIWNPKTAAKHLVQLIDDLTEKRRPSIIEGPASIA